MTRYLLTILSACFILSSGCWMDNVRGKGPVIKVNRSLGKFTGIELECQADVYLTQGDVYTCIIETQENIQPLILTNVDDDILNITTEKEISTEKLIIHITAPDIENLRIEGSGDIFGKNTINVKELNLKIAGSGNINMDKLITDDLKAEIEGSGDIKLTTGKTNNALYKIGGSGTIQADKIETEDVEAVIEGSGNIYCYAGETLDARINGSGNVKYKGEPKTKFSVEGSGNVSAY